MERKTKNQEATVQKERVKVNPLRNERVYVRFVPHKNGSADNPQHVLYGGLADGAKVTLCVPILRSTGHYKNVLTGDEKEYLEEALGLDYNALSVYNRNGNNYWDTYKVEITKDGLHLDLSDPEDYIKYKVLLANNEIVAPSVKERQDRPKMTYRFEIVNETEELDMEDEKVDATMESYREFGKIEDDYDTMRVLTEMLDGHPYALDTKIAFFKSRILKLIQQDAKTFLRYIKDPYLHSKVLIRRATELGVIFKAGDFYYMKGDNSPLCGQNEQPTLSIAARFINEPAHSDIKFLLESEVDKNKVK
jgi:hypothetical protein